MRKPHRCLVCWLRIRDLSAAILWTPKGYFHVACT